MDKIRKIDYVIFFVLTLLFFSFQLMAPLTIGAVIGVTLFSLISAAFCGTVTNLISLLFDRRKT
ncbi:hypothetical protein JCM19046_1630 [Bacillus sp. JCM 19046]|nr:hypothetical protein JCM19045_213 [Bacillus sp. JCM 19045]GAF17142.1 hypothetical protein JCM19046_1630 [Bacillus sp. JCM 19046]